MKKKLAAGLVAGAMLAGSEIPACSGMWFSFPGGITIPAVFPNLTPVTTDPTTTPEPEEEVVPPPPPPPLFVQADPQAFDLWDDREDITVPEESAPIVMEECVVIS